jgi:hypothetical protein
MLYNLHSYRQLVKVRIPELLDRRRTRDEVAALYDTNAAGDAAPHTDRVSAHQVRRLFAGFAPVQIDRRNFDNLRFVRRERLLGTLDRALGLDLYITARR